MTPGQRRVLWACTFAMTFIFWYEASGNPLTWESNAFKPSPEATSSNHFYSQFSYGLIFLILGGGLTWGLIDRKKKIQELFHSLDWVCLTVGIGILAGQLYRSYVAAIGSL